MPEIPSVTPQYAQPLNEINASAKPCDANDRHCWLHANDACNLLVFSATAGYTATRDIGKHEARGLQEKAARLRPT